MDQTIRILEAQVQKNKRETMSEYSLLIKYNMLISKGRQMNEKAWIIFYFQNYNYNKKYYNISNLNKFKCLRPFNNIYVVSAGWKKIFDSNRYQ